MAPALGGLRNYKRTMRRLRRKTINKMAYNMEVDQTLPDHIIAHVTGSRRDLWHRTAKAILDGTEAWHRGPLVTSERSLSHICYRTCEACLWHGPALLVRPVGEPGPLSGHEEGDWICGACDSRVEERLTLMRLDDLVNGAD